MASGIISSVLICMHLAIWVLFTLFISLLLAITRVLSRLYMRDDPSVLIAV